MAQDAFASTRFRWLLGFHVAKDAAKYWLLFSDKGKQLTAPVRRQLKEVIHAQCKLSMPSDPGGMFLVGP
jgi:hypothetical protein